MNTDLIIGIGVLVTIIALTVAIIVISDKRIKKIELPIREEWKKYRLKFVVWFNNPVYYNGNSIEKYEMITNPIPKFYDNELVWTLKQTAELKADNICGEPLELPSRDHRGSVVPKTNIREVHWYILPREKDQ